MLGVTIKTLIAESRYTECYSPLKMSFTKEQASLLQSVANVIKLFIAVSYDFSQ
jgi:hypothetical protein